MASLVAIWLAGCAATLPDSSSRYVEVAGAIRERYEEALPTLPAAKQRHYAQRLYRITGEARYLPLNRAFGRRLVDSLCVEIGHLATPGYPERRARQIVAAYPERTPKQQRRKRMLAEWGEIAYAKHLAFELTQAHYHGLLDDTHLSGYRRALDYLGTVDFHAFLVDPDVMEVYAAQVANLVYYLHDLGVADLRETVIDAFQRHYPPERDAHLSRASYRNKIYGMTHFVIAASDYYQKPVSDEMFDWILDDFAADLPRILAETKEDIYTEVGISFLLAGQEAHPVVRRLRDALLMAYDPGAGMVPAEDGGTDLATGEHRNVLAIMLLDWPERLHPGPLLELSFQERSVAARGGKAASNCGARAF
nr:DUF3541 domain-containing protein [Halomonas cerina]